MALMSTKDHTQFVDPSVVPPLTKALCHMTLTDYPPFLERLLGVWGPLSRQPFTGIINDTGKIEGLFTQRRDAAPIEAASAAAGRWLQTLPPAIRAAVQFPLNSHLWRHWHNTPLILRESQVELETLGLRERELALEVVRASLSPEGYRRTREVMANNRFLGELVNMTAVLNDWAFTFSIFGTPSTAEPWGWQLFGHHLALNCLFVNGQMVLSPVFLGVEPDRMLGPEQRRLFEPHESAALRLFESLTVSEQRRARLYGSMRTAEQPPGRYHPDDGRTVGGAFQDNRTVPYEGLSVSTLARRQRREMLALADLFLNNLPSGPAEIRMQEVTRFLEQTHFAWIGQANEVDPFYFRIHSPVALIEFDHHSGIFLANTEPERFHIHTIVRSPNGGDYGADLLRDHYALGGHARPNDLSASQSRPLHIHDPHGQAFHTHK